MVKCRCHAKPLIQKALILGNILMYYAVLLYLDVLEEPGGHLEELDHLKYLMFKNHFH